MSGTLLQPKANFTMSFQGISPKQSLHSMNDSGDTIIRRSLRDSYNGATQINGRKRVLTPFRNANNAGDFLVRKNYSCGGSNQINPVRPQWKGLVRSIIQQCDNTGVPAGICNPKFVYDSSDYVKYKKQTAYLNTYNDFSFVGYNNASYDADLRVKRF